MPWKLAHHRDVTCPRLFLSRSAVPCWGLNREFLCLQMFSLFHKETCEMLSIPVTCFAAVVAAGQARAAEERPRAGARSRRLRAEAGVVLCDRDRAGSGGSRRAAGPGPGPGGTLCLEGWGQGRLLSTPRGNRSGDRPEAVVRQGEYLQRNWSAGCSTWLFKFDLISLRSFFHLMLCKNWFYLPLIFFFSLPLLLWMNN